MPRHTPAYAMAMLMALTVPFASTVQAQLPPSQYDKLQRTLEEKFAPKKQAPKPAPFGQKKDDFIYVDPGASKKESDPKAKRSDMTWGESFSSLFSSFVGSGEAESRVPKGAFAEAGAEAGSTRHPSLFRTMFPQRSRTPSGRPEPAGDRKVPVAKPNSYVIQLSPTATDRDIEALLKKYNLKITKMIAPLGVITVEVDGAPTPVQSAPGATAQDSKAQLQNVLEPPLIRDLRKEKVVDGAFVNSTMEAKHLPKSKGATITVGSDVFSWRWNAGDGEDGNWGLKAIRMPPVWTILENYRKAHPDAQRPKIGIIDGGFAANPAVPFASMENVKPLVYHSAGCGTHHGMHVAGIIGARGGDQPGIDGIVPDARMDAIAVDDTIVGDSGHVGVDEGWQVHALLFDDVLAKTLDYVYANLMTPDGLRVINISLGYNFVASNLLGDDNPEEVPGLALHIMHQANLIRLMASRVQDHVLFVVAAGNDSEDRATPIEAKWASPFAWAGTQDSATGESPPNILVVEAVDRDGTRAEFSNLGGHVAAPGVDIMSTLAADKLPFGVCSGTSQAAPHVAALAAILFELAPDKKPAEIAKVLEASATAPPTGITRAPMIDALDAVAQVAPQSVRLLADLDGDGVVGPSDLAAFSRQVATLSSAATANTAFTEDLNGDGVIDDNECFWPQIDLNGSGHGALSPKDSRKLGGSDRTDLATMEFLWSDAATPFGTAVAATGLATPPEMYAVAESQPEPITKCRRMISTGVTVADNAATPAAPSNGEAATPLVTTSPGAAPSSSTTPTSAEAQETKAEVQRAVEELRKTHPNLRVTINPATGLPNTVMGLSPQPGAGSPSIGAAEAPREQTEEETKRAVESYFGTGGLSSLFPKKNKSAKPEYVGRRKDPDFPNRYVAEVEQRVDGVPVFGSTAKLNVDTSLGVTKFSGTISNVALDDTKPKIAEGEAIAAARAKLAEVLRSAPDASRAFPLAPNAEKAEVKKPDLLVFDPALVGKTKGGATRLAWMISIDNFRIFIDANTGEAFYYYRDQPSGMLRRIFDLGQMTAFPGTMGIDEEKRTRAEKLAPEALTAFRNAGIVRDYFFLTFGRDGFDDNAGQGGSPLEAYVRHGRTQNAYWCTSKSYDCPKANVMVYGPGYADALDIVAHEMTHGIIAHEKNLLYLNEPGAVNESLADIFGALIEFDAKGDGGNWLIGEASPGFSITSPLRSMADPNLKDGNNRSMFDRTARFSLANRGQPDHYADVLSPDDKQCGSTAYQDNGCVHFNSGILNKFAYLIAEGGTHRGVTVKGIGRYKLGRITYRAMTVGLNQSSTLSNAANAFVEGCFELASGELGGIIPADCEQVAASQRAVGLEVPSS
ncbi:M4 family metallopeptidase [Hyphomicrobium sp.]|uniref:M4 family metallopeptidase n=1 Tax=Hyphomicrobium sp. TaxID=82 RepID=UPI002E36BD8B|nr:M4 family metallopeptidase [Hyphomicrobium sp.]HEX2839887.1 M4 family metallopeptidase [Hyphomicrobium sp.]